MSNKKIFMFLLEITMKELAIKLTINDHLSLFIRLYNKKISCIKQIINILSAKG